MTTIMRVVFVVLFSLLGYTLTSASTSNATALAPNETVQCRSETFTHKPRYFVLSDIANEPDDTMSFVRLLTYANQLHIEGMVATTSTWLNFTAHPEQI